MAKDPNAKTDSVVHHEERRARMAKESEDVAVKQQEDQEIARSGVAVQVGETREQLLDRIRKLRDAAEPPPPPVFIPDAIKKQTELEQEAGRQMVAKAQAALEENRKIAERAAAVEAAGGKK